MSSLIPMPILLLSLLFIFSQYIPDSLIFLTDNVIIRIISIIFIVYITKMNYIYGIFAFIAVLAIYIERNKRKWIDVKHRVSSSSINEPEIPQMSVEEASIPQQTVNVLPFADADDALVQFLPYGETGENNFNAVAPTINNKIVLPTIELGEKGLDFYERNHFI